MKTLTAILFTLLTVDCTYLYGQQDTTGKARQFIKKNDIKFILKTDILLSVISAFEKRRTNTFTAEMCLRKRQSIQATGLISSYETTSRQESSIQNIVEYKYYLGKKKDYAGFYSGAYFKGLIYSYKEEITGDFPPYYTYLNYEQQSFGGGLICGYQNYIKKHFVIDFLIGLGGRYITDTKIIKAVNIGLDSQKQTVPDARLALNIGYKF